MVGHVTIGDHATLTARTGVTTNLAGGMVYSGRPAKPYHAKIKNSRPMFAACPSSIERVKALEKALRLKSAPED